MDPERKVRNPSSRNISAAETRLAIRNTVAQQIVDHRLGTLDRFPTCDELASSFGVSNALIYKSLNSIPAEDRLYRVRCVNACAAHTRREKTAEVINAQTQQPLLVTRLPNGNIAWEFPSFTPKQNEALGIRNMQALFIESYPEFDQLFPRGEDGKIAKNKREEVVDFILDKLGTQKKFSALFKGGAQKISYFENHVKNCRLELLFIRAKITGGVPKSWLENYRGDPNRREF